MAVLQKRWLALFVLYKAFRYRQTREPQNSVEQVLDAIGRNDANSAVLQYINSDGLQPPSDTPDDAVLAWAELLEWGMGRRVTFGRIAK